MRVKKLLSILTTITLLSSLPMTTFAADNSQLDNNQKNNLLVQNGFDIDTVDALEDEQKDIIVTALLENPDSVDISTTKTEVDNLAEIEEFVSLTDDELIDMGMSEELIEDTKENIYNMYEKNDTKLKEEQGLSQLEVDMFRMAVENGEEAKESEEANDKIIENTVNASGSIGSSWITYSQAITKSSSSKTPLYYVSGSYNWKKSFAIVGFSDNVVFAWGGGLNVKSLAGTARYHKAGYFTNYGAQTGTKKMSTEQTVQKGVRFIFPQRMSNTDRTKMDELTKTGSISFTLYQTKKKGYETNVISRYCHRVVGVDAGITITATGPGASIKAGGAWDKTPELSKTISY